MYEKFAGYSNKEKELLYCWEEIVMEKANKYQLEDYFDVLTNLKERYGDKCEVDIVRNKLGQDSVRIRYVIDKLKEFDMFIFGSDFAVAYKPNGRVKMYSSITPKQARQIAKASIDWWFGL